MRELKRGMFARSLAGHDKGRLYLVTDVSEDYILLSDGRGKSPGCPKRKNRIHLQPCFQTDPAIRDLLLRQQPLTNKDIRNAIIRKEELSCQKQM